MVRIPTKRWKTDDVRETRWEKLRQEREERKSKRATKRLLGGKKRITEGKKEDEQVEEKLLIVSKMSC